MAGADTVQRERLPIGAGKSLDIPDTIVAPLALEPSNSGNPLSTVSFSYIQAAAKQPAARATELFSNVVQVPGLDSDYGNRPIDLGTLRDDSPWARIKRFSNDMKVYAVALLGSLGLLSESSAGLMKDSNYNNPTTHQQHLDLGATFQGKVVFLTRDGLNVGSGVVINNPRCVLATSHETESASTGTFFDPNTNNFYITACTNYLNNSNTPIRVSQIIRHPTRISPGVGTDLAILILESDLPGAVPATIATSAPPVGDVLKLIGFGIPAVSAPGNTTILPATGDIIGGFAPVNTIDSADIKTKFIYTSSQPLIFNATEGHSGGAIINSENKLCGIMRIATSPASSASTYSVNLTTATNYNWVGQVTSPYNTNPLVIPTLGIQKNADQVTLTVNCSLAQNGGTWILQRSSNQANWTNSTEQFVGNTCTLTNSAPQEFYRMQFIPAQ